MKRLIGYAIVSLALAGIGLWVAAQVDLTTFAPGTVIRADEVNANFAGLASAVEALQARPALNALNGLEGEVDLVAGGNVAITVDDAANRITIAATAAGGGDDTSAVTALNGLEGEVDLVAGGNVAITVDDATNQVTIAATTAGGDITAVTAGAGLSGGGDSGDVTLAVDPDAVQTRVASACASGSAVRAIDATGGVACEPIREIQSGSQSTVWYKSSFRPLTFHLGGDERAYIRVQDNSPSEYFMQFLLNTPSGTNVAPLTLLSTGSSRVNGDLQVTGTLSKGSGSFRIDHPLDPTRRYLSHSFVESPDMMNVYNGNVTTDADGYATVPLPDYFEALNRDYRYQLTVIGTFAQAIVAQEVAANRFVIRSDRPHVKVSWQVTGVRRDPFAEANRIEVETLKPPHERGSYLHPEAYGLAAERGLAARTAAGR